MYTQNPGIVGVFYFPYSLRGYSYYCPVLSLPDLHTHIPKERCWHMLNVHEHFNAALPYVCSTGLHPWYISADAWENDFYHLELIANRSEVCAIGECGLDTLCTTPLPLQQKVFTAQVQLAHSVNKPLIIHCVRAHAAIIEILRNLHVSVPVIFHGFNRNLRIAQMLLKENFYLSWGEALFNPFVQSVFKHVPSDRIFIETDFSVRPIHEMYERAAQIKNENMTKFVNQIHQNYFRVFGIEFF